jgi:hypothetical protein
MKYFSNKSNRLITALFILSAFATASLGQVMSIKGVATESAINASVTPVFFEGPGEAGNPDCADLNALYVNGSGDIRFSHIITDNELKLDFGTPNGTFPYTTGNGRIVIGPQNPNQSVTVSSTGSTVNSWSSTLQVTAVILKTGSNAYVYPYKPFAYSDTSLVTGSQQSISHLTFCFGDPTNPTAGEATVSGRVIDASGMGISKAQVVLVNGSTGETKITMTSPFGYYRFDGLDVNELYVLNVSHKRYKFSEKQRTVMIGDDMVGVDFMASPY